MIRSVHLSIDGSNHAVYAKEYLILLRGKVQAYSHNGRTGHGIEECCLSSVETNKLTYNFAEVMLTAEAQGAGATKINIG